MFFGLNLEIVHRKFAQLGAIKEVMVTPVSAAWSDSALPKVPVVKPNELGILGVL